MRIFIVTWRSMSIVVNALAFALFASYNPRPSSVAHPAVSVLQQPQGTR